MYGQNGNLEHYYKTAKMGVSFMKMKNSFCAPFYLTFGRN